MRNKKRVMLSAALLVVVGCTFALFWVLTERIGHDATATQVEELLDDTERRAFSRIRSPIEDIDRVLDVLTFLAGQEDRSPNTDWAMLQALEFVPELSGVYLANSSGDFHFAFRTNDGYGTKTVGNDAASGERVVRFVDFDSDLAQVDAWEDPSDTFDPRTRPWYEAAVAAPGDSIWTEPYLFFTSQEPGITQALAAPDAASDWVVGVDVQLTSLVELLDELSTQNSGEVALFDGDNTAVTRRGLVDLTGPPSDQDARLRAAFDAQAGADGAGRIEYKIDGQLHTTRFAAVPLGGQSWSLVTDIAQADVAIPVSGLVRALQLLALGISTIAAVVLVLLMKPALVRLEHDAYFDALTGLPNRRAILQRGQIESAGNKSLVVAMIDVDRFKRVNDGHGHAVGDEALRELANRLPAPGHQVGRLGGEEFIVLLTQHSHSAATAKANDMRRSIEAKPVMTSAGPIALTVSIGVASHQTGETFTDLLKRADTALLKAKLNGRNRVLSANPPQQTDDS